MLNKFLPLNRLEFAVTYQCNGKCRHCYTAGGKENYPQHIDSAVGEEIIERVSRNFNIESVMTFGGEPLLFPQITAGIHRQARKSGIPGREVITNGYWSKHAGKIREIANLLHDSGVNELIFSVDCFHQEFIPVDCVKNSIITSCEAKIKKVILNPCWVVSRNDQNIYNEKTRKILAELAELPVKVSEGNIVEPMGLAQVNLKDFLPPLKALPQGRCEDIPYSDSLDNISSICIEPDGKIDICNGLHIGNAREKDILEILKNYQPHEVPLLNAIISEGMEGLIKFAQKYNVEPADSGYFSICDLCIDIRRRLAGLSVD